MIIAQQIETQLCTGGKGVTVELSVRGLLSNAVASRYIPLVTFELRETRVGIYNNKDRQYSVFFFNAKTITCYFFGGFESK